MSATAIPFVIASTPRSATKYMANLLTEIGVPCVHEQYFDVDRQLYFPADNRGCVSWLSVPFLDRLPESTVLLHQVKNPVDTINSLIDTHNIRLGEGPNLPFLRKHFSFAGDNPEIEFWFEWHQRIDRYCHWTYRVEDTSIYEVLCALGWIVPSSIVERALRLIPTNLNTYGSVPQYIGWNDLPEHVRHLAHRYGY